MMTLHERGLNSAQIADELNARGILTPKGLRYYPELVFVRGCTEFCVNGLMAGNRRTSRSGYDRKYKESSTQRSDRQFAG